MKTAHALALAASGLVLLAVAGKNQIRSIMISNQDALNDPNVAAFLAMIRHFEGGDRYDLLYHTSRSDPLYNPANPLTFSDFSTHPNVHIPFTDPKTGKANYSTAAGAYQFIHRTWLGLSLLPGAPKDFGRAAQDWYAVQALKGIGALTFIVEGNIQRALEIASGTWASLPYTDSMQAHRTVQQAMAAYSQAGGKFT